MASSSQHCETRARRVDFRSERFATRIVLGRALQETRALAADCNPREFDSLVENDPSSVDLSALAFLARREAFLKV
jgi:hypothetical protein